MQNLEKKIICNYSNSLALPECNAPTLNPYKTARHVFLHHIKTIPAFNRFIVYYNYLITGKTDFDNDRFYSTEVKPLANQIPHTTVGGYTERPGTINRGYSGPENRKNCQPK